MGGRNRLIAALLLGIGTPTAAADQQPICPDRPAKANSACTAPAGHFQVETGLADWTLDRVSGERDTVLVLGTTAIKYGLTDRANLEFDINPYVRATSQSAGVRESASGFGDLLVRYKQMLTGRGGPFQIAIFPFVKLPTAKHSLGNGKVEAGLEVPMAYAIPRSSLSLAIDPELDWLADRDGTGRHLAMTQVADIGWQVTPKLGLTAELWGRWDWDPAGTTRQASADGSVSYLVSNNVQLDAGANFGLNRQTPDVEVYAGVSKRF